MKKLSKTENFRQTEVEKLKQEFMDKQEQKQQSYITKIHT